MFSMFFLSTSIFTVMQNIHLASIGTIAGCRAHPVVECSNTVVDRWKVGATVAASPGGQTIDGFTN